MTAVIQVEEQKCLPLGKFVNGKVNSKQAGELNCRLLKRKSTSDDRVAKQRIMVAETSHMTYTGRNFGATSLDQSRGLMKYYVGVYDEKTGTMKVHDTEIFNMQPYIPGQEKETARPAEDEQKSIKQKMDSLVSAFGSKKQKRNLESRQRLAIDEKTLKGALNSAIDHGIEQAKSHKQEQAEALTDNKDLETTCPCNKEATVVEDVYSLDKIITKNEMEELEYKAKIFYDCNSKQIAEWRKEKKYSEYILNHLSTMPVMEAQRWRRSKLLYYLSAMLFMYTCKPNELARKDPAFPEHIALPHIVRNKLLDNFTMLYQAGNGTRRCRPSRLKERLASYILVLCLIIDEFVVVLDNIQQATAIKKAIIEKHAQALGCRITRQQVSEDNPYPVSIATLKIPLMFPSNKGHKMGRY